MSIRIGHGLVANVSSGSIDTSDFLSKSEGGVMDAHIDMGTYNIGNAGTVSAVEVRCDELSTHTSGGNLHVLSHIDMDGQNILNASSAVIDEVHVSSIRPYSGSGTGVSVAASGDETIFYGDNTTRWRDMPDPTLPGELANKRYVDNNNSGIRIFYTQNELSSFVNTSDWYDGQIVGVKDSTPASVSGCRYYVIDRDGKCNAAGIPQVWTPPTGSTETLADLINARASLSGLNNIAFNRHLFNVRTQGTVPSDLPFDGSGAGQYCFLEIIRQPPSPLSLVTITNYKGYKWQRQYDASIPVSGGWTGDWVALSGDSGSSTLTVYTTGGSANSYTLTPSPAISSYSAGQRFTVMFHAANTSTTVNINISGLGNKRIYQYGTTSPLVGQIQANSIWEIYYDGTNFILLAAATLPTPTQAQAEGTTSTVYSWSPARVRNAGIAALKSRITLSGTTLSIDLS